MFDLEGRTAVITGGAAGIGFAVGQRFRYAGAEVVLADVVDGTDAAAGIGARYEPLDVSDERAVAGLFHRLRAEIGPIDIVVNNAGITGRDNFVAIAEGQATHFGQVIGVNQMGVFFGLKHAPASMRDGGSIINTSSLASTYSLSGNSQYSATKAAVESMTRVAALELGPRGIRVNAVAPAFMRTAMGASALGEAIAEDRTAFGRLGEMADLIGAYHFLAADESRYMTGQTLCIDGGMGLGITERAMARYASEEKED
jgi:NAD(P)-dependent dehydrogenase (short-subunit alcohol dehydrogenase family)